MCCYFWVWERWGWYINRWKDKIFLC